MANGCIREKQPGCPMQAVIPSVTIESIEGIKKLADCLVHVSDINTTFYIDDKHRPIITWAGPIDIPGYDMESNPNNYRDQIVTDVANQEAVIYDKSGRGYVFGLVENIDLQEQVNNKLDEMAEDGTLADLLYEILAKVSRTPIYLMSTWSGSNAPLRLMTSIDGINYSDFKQYDNLGGNDSCIFYKDGKYYITVTRQSTTRAGVCYITEDFEQFTTKDITIPVEIITTNVYWGPELFEDKDGNIKLTLTYGPASGNKQCYIYDVESLEGETINCINENPINVNLTSAIDSSIFYDADINRYVLTIKKETDISVEKPQIKIYTSQDLYTWTLVNSDVLSSGGMNGIPCEGGSVRKCGSHYLFYGDLWTSFGYNVIGESKDLVTWKLQTPSSLIGNRHGSILCVTDNQEIAKITGDDDYTNNVAIRYPVTRGVVIDSSADELILYPDFYYSIRGASDVTIGKIYNPFKVDSFNFDISAGNITFNIEKIENTEGVLKNTNYSFKNTKGTNGKSIKINLIGDTSIFGDNSSTTLIDVTENYTANPGWVINSYKYRYDKNTILAEFQVTRESGTGTYPIRTDGLYINYTSSVPTDHEGVTATHYSGYFDLKGTIQNGTTYKVTFILMYNGDRP